MAILGAPSLLLWPALIVRDSRARLEAAELQGARTQPDRAIELAFRQLLALPRTAAISLLLTSVGASLAIISLIPGTVPADGRTLALLVTLSLASLAPLVSTASTRVRAMLVPEHLSAPRPEPLAVPTRARGERVTGSRALHNLALRLGGPAALALAGAVMVPALGGALWTERVAVVEQRELGEAQAKQLLELARSGDRAKIGEFLARHPSTGVSIGDERYGSVPDAIGPQRGLVDVDGDDQGDHWIETAAGASGELLVSVPYRAPAPTPALLLVAAIGLGLVSGLATLVLLLRDVERDVSRASRQVAAVADGEIPEPMAVETFATAELRGLVSAIDRLVGRITDANVAKYVAIERGQEADRLKSQFLANMSHDLRSPLNSVLGFSELLSTGIEGELAPEQLEMVGTIHRTGKDLLQQIDDILDTAKIEAGRMELHREPTPVITLVSRAIQRARLRVGQPIEFDTTSAPGLPPAFVDTYRTTQALENVLLFAAEGLTRGTIEIQCDVEREGRGREIVVRVKSPRALVPLEVLEQARRGFFRLPGHTGLGLGLPIATSVLELQNGSLTIEDGSSSSLGGRAAMGFELRLPALAARRGARARLRVT